MSRCVTDDGHVKLSSLNSADQQELYDRVVGSGPAQQALLSVGPDLENPSIQNIRTKLKKKNPAPPLRSQMGSFLVHQASKPMILIWSKDGSF